MSKQVHPRRAAPRRAVLRLSTCPSRAPRAALHLPRTYFFFSLSVAFCSRARHFLRASFVPPLTIAMKSENIGERSDAHVAHAIAVSESVAACAILCSRSLSVTEILAHLSASAKGHRRRRSVNTDYLFRDTPRALGLIIDRCVIIKALLWLDQLQRAMRATSHLREMTISSS